MLKRLQRLVRAFLQRGSADEIPPEIGTPGLAPCPETPNCVSSAAEDRMHHIAPLPWSGSGEDGIDAVAAIVRAESGTAIWNHTPDYLHATYRIPVLGWIDDVEFLWDAEAGVLQVRSASRVGHGDLGVNRRRIERIRKRLNR